MSNSSFKTDLLNTYNHFINFTIRNKIFNILLIIIENAPILIAIDFMWMDDFLSKIFTPLYFLAPHIYLDKINKLFLNDCSMMLPTEVQDTSILTDTNSTITNSSSSLFYYISQSLLKQVASNITTNLVNITNNNSTNTLDNTTLTNLTLTNQTDTSGSTTDAVEPKLIDIYFFKSKIMQLDNNYCLYSPVLNILFYILTVLIFVSFFTLGKISGKSNKKTCLTKTYIFFNTNFINIISRTFSYLFFVVFLNRPIILLYQNTLINTFYFSNIIIYTAVSVFFLSLFLIYCYLFLKFMNNSFFFEDYPYDSFSVSDSSISFVIKILIGLKFNFDKLTGFRYIKFINYLLGLFIVVRMCVSVANRNSLINNYMLKTLRNYFSFFFAIYLALKLLNNSIEGLRDPNDFVIVIEMLVIASIMFIINATLLKIDFEYVFNEKEKIINEMFRFFYHTNNNLIGSRSPSSDASNGKSNIKL